MMRVEVVNYRLIQKELKVADVAVQKNLNKSLKVLMAEVVQQSRSAASWSNTIPAAIVPLAATTGAGVRVKKTVPIAPLNERPSGNWRHPVFGNKAIWVDQPARPSVRPTVARARARLVPIANTAVNEAFKEAGIL